MMRINISSQHPEKTPPPQWMLSFADLLSLIFAFFVLIFATANPVPKKTFHNEQHGTEISATTTDTNSKISLEKGSEDISNNYLYKILYSKIKEDKELRSLKFKAIDGNLVISASYEQFDQMAFKLARLLKVTGNDLWLYSPSLDVSHNAYLKLKESGLNREMTFAEKYNFSGNSKSQIDIVIYP